MFPKSIRRLFSKSACNTDATVNAYAPNAPAFPWPSEGAREVHKLTQPTFVFRPLFKRFSRVPLAFFSVLVHAAQDMRNHRPKERGRLRRGHGGHDDRTRAVGRMPSGPSAQTELRIPPLSSFTFGSAEEAVAGGSIEVGERIGHADDIPLNYSRPSAYLKVRGRVVVVCQYIVVRPCAHSHPYHPTAV